MKKGFEEASEEKNDFVIYGVNSPNEIVNLWFKSGFLARFFYSPTLDG
jgi:hypothetical protein